VGPGAQGGGRTDRPLGRGLEDVARVFLTQEGVPAGAEPTAAPRVGRPPPRDDPGSGALLLRPASRVSREQIARTLRHFEGALEEGLRVVDEAIPCGACGEIDLLGVDRTARLSIIDFDPASADELLIRGLGHLDWVAANEPNLRRMLRGQAINFSLEARLFLLAPRFSARLGCAARRLASLRIEWIGYHLVEIPGQVGILFEPVSLD